MTSSQQSLVAVLLLVGLPLAGAVPLGAADVVEIVFLGGILFYADVISDFWSLSRFWRRGQNWFFGINAGGIALNMIASAVLGYSTYSFSGLLLGFTQLHVLVAMVGTLYHWKKPPVDDNETFFSTFYRGFELIEATCSFSVQGYTMVWDTDLSSSDERQLQISVFISLVSLANGLTLLDKPQSRAAWKPVIQSIASVEYMVIFLFRVSELVFSFGSLFLFQLATRPYGAFIVLPLYFTVFGLECLYHRLRNVDVDHPLEDAGLALLLIPLVFVHAIPAASVPGKVPMTIVPSQTLYFAQRYITAFGMSIYLILTFGRLQDVWTVWSEYNDSATYLAYAVGVSAITYPLTFAAVSCWRSAPPRGYHGAHQDDTQYA